jgi:hypothetical protein
MWYNINTADRFLSKKKAKKKIKQYFLKKYYKSHSYR